MKYFELYRNKGNRRFSILFTVKRGVFYVFTEQTTRRGWLTRRKVRFRAKARQPDILERSRVSFKGKRQRKGGKRRRRKGPSFNKANFFARPLSVSRSRMPFASGHDSGENSCVVFLHSLLILSFIDGRGRPISFARENIYRNYYIDLCLFACFFVIHLSYF